MLGPSEDPDIWQVLIFSLKDMTPGVTIQIDMNLNYNFLPGLLSNMVQGGIPESEQ